MRFLRRCRHRYWLFSDLILPCHFLKQAHWSDSLPLSLQDQGTEAEPRAGRASPTRTGHLNLTSPSHYPGGRFLQSLRKEGDLLGRRRPCWQLSQSFGDRLRSPPSLSEVLNSFSSLPFPSLGHSLLSSLVDFPLRSPAVEDPRPTCAPSAVASAAPPPAPPRPLPDLPYLFVRRVSECMHPRPQLCLRYSPCVSGPKCPLRTFASVPPLAMPPSPRP